MSLCELPSHSRKRKGGKKININNYELGRTCNVCGIYKPIEDYRLVENKDREPYYRKYCRECEKKYQSDRRHKIDTTIGFSSSVGEKECTKCKITKLLSDFSIHNSSKDGRNCWCKDCQKQHRQNNKHRYKQKQLKRIQENLDAWEVEFKKRGLDYCIDCGMNDPRVLHLDHIGEKRIKGATLRRRPVSLKYLKELDKLVRRCGNCHHERHCNDPICKEFFSPPKK